MIYVRLRLDKTFDRSIILIDLAPRRLFNRLFDFLPLFHRINKNTNMLDEHPEKVEKNVFAFSNLKIILQKLCVFVKIIVGFSSHFEVFR